MHRRALLHAAGAAVGGGLLRRHLPPTDATTAHPPGAPTDRSGHDRRDGESTVTADGLSLDQVTLGNVFTADETPAVRVDADARPVHWRVEDYRGRVVAEDTTDCDAELELPIADVGHYTVHLRTETDPPTTTRTALAVLPAEPVEHDDPFFGLSTQFDAEQSLDWLDVLAHVGVESVREDTGWWNVESARGEYDFSAVDGWVDPIGEHGFDRLLILAYGNDVYDPEDRGYFTIPDTEEYRRGFADFGAETVAHYEDVGHVEVWNEPNLHRYDGQATPADYAALLETTADAVREQRSDVSVVGGATAGCCDVWEWWEEMLAAGGGEHADALSIHPYRTPPEGFAADVERLRELAADATGGDPPPIWVTELGWGTAPWLSDGDRDRWQARYLVRSHVQCKAAGVARFYWYTLGDTVYEDDVDPQTFDGSYRMGLVRHPEDPLGSETPKPGLVAYAPMARRLAGTDLHRVASPPDGVAAFASEDGGTWVCWADELVDVTVRADGPVTLTTMLGESHELTPVDGATYCTIGEDPIYLSGPVGGIEAGAPVELERVETRASEADRLRAHASDAPASEVVVEVDDRSVSLAADGGDATETIDLPQAYRGRTATVEARVTADGAPVGRLLTRTGTPSARFSDPPVFDGLHVDTRNEGEELVGHSRANDVGTAHSDFDVVAREGATGWRTDVHAGFTADYLFVDVADDHRDALGDTVPVTVEYFDEGTGMFTVVYDGDDGEAVSETVDLRDTGAWKTHTFELEDARLEGGLYAGVEWHTEPPGYDFRVGVGHESTGWSEQDVIFGSITVGREPAVPVEPGHGDEAGAAEPCDPEGGSGSDEADSDDDGAEDSSNGSGSGAGDAAGGDSEDGSADDAAAEEDDGDGLPGPGFVGTLAALGGGYLLARWRDEDGVE